MAVAKKVHVLDCGAMSCDLTWLLLKPGRSIRTRAERDKPVEWYPCTTHAVLVETDEGTMLWDTSCPRDWETRWVPTGLQEFFPYDQVTDEQYLDARLGQLGVSPEQLDYVVLSHLHFDHAGNVRMFAGTGARLVCNDKEKEFAFGYDGAFNGAHLKADYEGLDFETVSGDAEFLPGGHAARGAGPHARHHVDAGRARRLRHDDLHLRRDLHGRLLRPSGHARRDRQRPRRLVLLGGEDPRHRREDRRDSRSSATTPTQLRGLRLAPEGFYT